MSCTVYTTYSMLTLSLSSPFFFHIIFLLLYRLIFVLYFSFFFFIFIYHHFSTLSHFTSPHQRHSARANCRVNSPLVNLETVPDYEGINGEESINSIGKKIASNFLIIVFFKSQKKKKKQKKKKRKTKNILLDFKLSFDVCVS